tara:strand:+ start:1270 stop:1932 length:663 start_codon:yes stop_codon:yes gene_type:complete
METKQVLNLGMEIKEVDDKGMTFTAYGSATGVKDLVDDVIEKGAYNSVISKAETTKKYPKLLYQHNYKDIIGVIEDMNEDEKGLLVKGRFIDTTKGRDAYTEVKEGAIDSMSIGFMIGDYSIDKKSGVRRIQTIKSLPEISFVTFPANEAATVVNVKQKDDIIDVRVLEKHLREANLSRNEAKAIISGGIPKLKSQRDADTSKEDTLKAFNDVLCALKLN